MAESHIVSGLIAKRSELAGLIDHHQAEASRLAGDLVHLDATLKMFSPELNLSTIKRKQYRRYSRLFKQGECHRLSLDTLRRVGGTSNTSALAGVIMKLKEIPSEQYQTVCDSVNNSLRYAEKTNKVRRDGMDGASIVWVLL